MKRWALHFADSCNRCRIPRDQRYPCALWSLGESYCKKQGCCYDKKTFPYCFSPLGKVCRKRWTLWYFPDLFSKCWSHHHFELFPNNECICKTCLDHAANQKIKTIRSTLPLYIYCSNWANPNQPMVYAPCVHLQLKVIANDFGGSMFS